MSALYRQLLIDNVDHAHLQPRSAEVASKALTGSHQSQLSLNLYHDPLARQQIKSASENQCHVRTTEDNDVIGHAEIRGGEVDKECRGINPFPIVTQRGYRQTIEGAGKTRPLVDPSLSLHRMDVWCISKKLC